MIIVCPTCKTRYAIADNAIGADGRTVRCTKCTHSWFQNGTPVEESASAEEDSQNTEAGLPPSSPPPLTPPAPPISTPLPPIAPQEEDDFVSHFDHAPFSRTHRKRGRLWVWVAVAFIILAMGGAIAVMQFGTPSWWPVDKPAFGKAQPDLELRFPVEKQSWRKLGNGAYLFSARIEVSNKARESRKLPPIQIVILNEQEQQIFTWIVPPPQPTLAPGETIMIDEASTQVPRSAVYADVGWVPM